ncbi:MAG: hypothetical protein JWN73_440 [Betaproteobacteria bacterium]|nr:hypothetical protein [Betaproteobacteria bacterium]
MKAGSLARALSCAFALLQLPVEAAAAPKKEASKDAKKEARPAAKDAYAGVVKPVAPVDLLRNLKFALDHHLLLTDSFYEEKNLQRFFGNERTRWYRLPRPFIRSGKLQGFGGVFAPSGDGMAVDVLYKYIVQGTQEKRRAMIGLDVVRDARATAETVVSVFGIEGHVVDPAAQDAPGRAQPLTPGNHPVGNKVLSYDFDGSASKGSLNVMINGDGSIANIIVTEEEKLWSLAPLVASPKQAAESPR